MDFILFLSKVVHLVPSHSEVISISVGRNISATGVSSLDYLIVTGKKQKL